ncbi:MAG: DUF47 family protein [Crenarchaeota archaeon]|nr:DUF47 family protein [Thermoproteota archaeon]
MDERDAEGIDYVEPESEAKVFSSIAELNLVEALVNISSNLVEELRYALEAAEKMKGGVPGEIDESLRRVREIKENIEKSKDKAMEYLVRLPSGLIMKDTFKPVVLGLTNAAQYIDGSYYRLGVLAKKKKAYESLLNTTKELTDILRDQVEKLAKAIRVVEGNPKLALKYIDESMILEDKIDHVYRSSLMEVLEGARDCASAVLAWEIVGNLEDASDIIKDVAENFKYFLLHKV